jgi:uncharacterized protein YehS (DUF1456 family)
MELPEQTQGDLLVLIELAFRLGIVTDDLINIIKDRDIWNYGDDLSSVFDQPDKINVRQHSEHLLQRHRWNTHKMVRDFPEYFILNLAKSLNVNGKC